jgi:hypothetical protein
MEYYCVESLGKSRKIFIVVKQDYNLNWPTNPKVIAMRTSSGGL